MAWFGMTMTLDIPDDLLRELGAKFDDVGRAALEGLASKAYVEGALSLEQVRRLLDLPSRWEAEAVLKRHRAWPAATVGEVLSDLEGVRSSQAPK